MSFFAVDIGNTKISIAIVNEKKIIHPTFIFNNEWEELFKKEIWNILKTDHNIFLGISCVAPTVWNSLKNFLKHHNISFRHHLIHHKDKKNIHLVYKKKETLGSDRLVLIHKAQKQHPCHLVLVVDAGTVMSMDIIVKKHHMGGMLTAGMHTNLSIMNNHAELLTKINPIFNECHFLGKSTKECLLSGIFYEKKCLIKNTIAHLSQTYPSIKKMTWITGGDSSFFESVHHWDICDKELIFHAIFEWFENN